MGRKRRWHQLNRQHRRQGHQGWQSCAKIMCRQTQMAGMGRQTLLVARRMLDGVRRRRQLGEEDCQNEKETAQMKHLFSLSGLHYVRMSRRAGQST